MIQSCQSFVNSNTSWRQVFNTWAFGDILYSNHSRGQNWYIFFMVVYAFIYLFIYFLSKLIFLFLVCWWQHQPSWTLFPALTPVIVSSNFPMQAHNWTLSSYGWILLLPVLEAHILDNVEMEKSQCSYRFPYPVEDRPTGRCFFRSSETPFIASSQDWVVYYL
jgi:hypothetical protein